jgi:hypothetical protein
VIHQRIIAQQQPQVETLYNKLPNMNPQDRHTFKHMSATMLQKPRFSIENEYLVPTYNIRQYKNENQTE